VQSQAEGKGLSFFCASAGSQEIPSTDPQSGQKKVVATDPWGMPGAASILIDIPFCDLQCGQIGIVCFKGEPLFIGHVKF
jgi:hypothetical protein